MLRKLKLYLKFGLSTDFYHLKLKISEWYKWRVFHREFLDNAKQHDYLSETKLKPF